MKILIVYGTTEGHTRSIARFMEEKLQAKGHAVSIADASDEPPSPENFDLVIIGGSMHAMKYQSAVDRFVRDYIVTLNKKPSVFFSVSLGVVTGEEKDLDEARRIASEFAADAGWKPKRIELIAGALKYTQYDFFKRLVMRYISGSKGGDTDTSQDYEYTDWVAVERFCDEVPELAKEPSMV
jgi:menaquinone-dependent protoporphyrinogen oxidase